MYNFLVLTVTIFYARGILIVAGGPIEQSKKHDLSSYCEVIKKRPATDAEMGPAMITNMAYEGIFAAAANYPFYEIESKPFYNLSSQIVAAASANLLVKLSIMEDVNDVIFNSTWYACHNANFSRSSSKDAFLKILDNVVSEIERNILANPSLAPLYKEEKSKLEKVPSPSSNKRINTLLKTNLHLLDFSLREQVLRYASKSCYESSYESAVKKGEGAKVFRIHYLSKAILQLARSDKVSRIQTLFDDSIKVVGEKIQTNGHSRFEHYDVFFSTLEEKLKLDPELENEVTSVKNDLIKKYGIQLSS